MKTLKKVLLFICLFSITHLSAQQQDNYILVIDYQFDFTYGFISKDLAAVCKGDYSRGKWGYIDQTGKLVIDYKFDGTVAFYSYGLAYVIKRDADSIKYGYIDQTGKLVIDYQFDDAANFYDDDLAPVRKGDSHTGKWGYINQAGNLVIDYQFDYAYSFNENGLAGVRKGNDDTGKWGYIDKTGKLIIDYQYDETYGFSLNGLASVRKGDDKTGKWGYIDQNGILVIDYQYDKIRGFNDAQLSTVRKGDEDTGKWGLIDRNGKLVIDYQFDDIDFYSAFGLIAVRKGDEKSGKWGYIDQTGKLVINYQFDKALVFNSNGFASVRKGDDNSGKWGFIDRSGNLVVDYLFDYLWSRETSDLLAVKKDGKWGFVKLLTPTNKIETFVKTEISKWQQKGKYETTAAYTARVSEINRKKKLEELLAAAVQSIAPTYCNWKTITTEYDADNQTYKITVKGLPPFYLKVPLADAESFDKALAKLKFSNLKYALSSDGIFYLQKAIIQNPINGKNYAYSSTEKAVFAYTQLNINFEPLQMNVQTTNNTQTVKDETKSVTVGLAEVDVNIPVNPQTNDKTFVVIIANENYSREVKVQFAVNDGKVFKDYCEKTLGIPQQNIHFSPNATFGVMKSEIKWISDVIEAYKGQAKVIFYYAGHGMPNETNRSAYLLPVDGFSSDFETAIKLDDLYNRFTANPSQCVTYFLDACFSGSARENSMLAQARGVKIKPKADMLNGRSVVFSAATGDETAYPYKEKQHGLFTYFLLKKLQETKGDVDYLTLSNYISENVKQKSIVINQKSQSPQIVTSLDLESKWQLMKLK